MQSKKIVFFFTFFLYFGGLALALDVEAVRIDRREIGGGSVKVLFENVSQKEVTGLTVKFGKALKHYDWTSRGGILPGKQRILEFKFLEGTVVPDISIIGLLFKDDSGEGESESLRGRRQAVREFQVYKKVTVQRFLQERPDVTATDLLELKLRFHNPINQQIKSFPSQSSRDGFVDGWKNSQEQMEREVDGLQDEETKVPQQDQRAFRRARLEEIRDRGTVR